MRHDCAGYRDDSVNAMSQAGSVLDVVERYHAQIVGPLLDRRIPGLAYAAGRLGGGSEVLGLDDATSRDHDWGLRLTLLVPLEQIAQVRDVLDAEVPGSFDGLPTRFATTWRPEPALGIDVTTVEEFVAGHLGFEATQALSVGEWLSVTGQQVLEVIAGPVFLDRPGTLTAVRERLAWYPDDIWMFAIAGAWRHVDEELPFVGRSATRGDELGSRVIAARIVRHLGSIAFLLDRRWAPYSKWFGSVLATLPTGAAIAPSLNGTLEATTWEAREAHIAEAIETLAVRQRALALPTPDRAVHPFHDRPFRTLGPFTDELLTSLGADFQELGAIGTVEQWSDSVPALLSSSWRTNAARGWLQRHDS